MHLPACFWEVGGNPEETQRKPGREHGKLQEVCEMATRLAAPLCPIKLFFFKEQKTMFN